jgi:hypothetical protein
MTTNATSLLGLALPVTGELSGTWGDVVNSSITALLDSAVAGTTTLTTDADVTLSTTALAANEARQAVILWTAGGTATRYITAPAQSKTYIVINKTSSTQSIVVRGVGPTTGVTVLAGRVVLVVWNGVDFVASAGDVIGPTSATDNAITRFDGTTGKLLQNSVVTVSDTGVVAGITDISGNPTLSSGTTNGVVYLNGSKALTTGSAMTFDGTIFKATKVTQGSGTVAFGLLAGASSQGSFAVAIGNTAGNSTQGASAVAIGNGAGSTSQSNSTVAIGGSAGETSQGGSAVAVGSNAGATSQGTNAVAIGAAAGGNTQGSYAVAIGRTAGIISQGSYAVSIGDQAGVYSQGASAIAIGNQAGYGPSGVGQGANAIAIGNLAGYASQPANTVIINATGSAINGVASQTDSFYIAPVRSTATASALLFYDTTTKELTTSTSATNNNIVIGVGAGTVNSASSDRIAMGTSAGATTQGGSTVAIGKEAGNSAQGFRSVAIGNSAGGASQGSLSVAIGYSAGASGQGGGAVAIGDNAGSLNQGAYAIAIGGQASAKGTNGIAIGYQSGGTSTGSSVVFVGDQAGYGASSANYSVAIGYKAAYSNGNSNVITLNATGAALDGVSAQSSSFYVAPIRTDSTAIANSLRYNTTTKEVTYTNTIGYDTGSGGTVTQLTSRTTGVTLNKLSGAITLFTAAGSATAATFTVTNSTVTAADTIIVNQKSGTNLYVTAVTAVAAGSFNITFYTTGGTSSDAPVFNFNVIHGATA